MHNNYTNSYPKVVSLVPSWTETLIEANVNVVGRTRFCIHPAQKVKDIAVVGGTKSVDIDQLSRLKPDFIVVDQQENTREMADQLTHANHKLIITNITDFESLETALAEIGSTLKNGNLAQFATRYQQLRPLDRRLFLKNIIFQGSVDEVVPGQHYEYVIWKDPFMVVGQQTFIAENFKRIGIQLIHKEKYPQISDEQLLKSFCFFSSEPFPFAKKYAELKQLGFKGIVVDGEKISWFGLRNLQFLEASQVISP